MQINIQKHAMIVILHDEDDTRGIWISADGRQAGRHNTNVTSK